MSRRIPLTDAQRASRREALDELHLMLQVAGLVEGFTVRLNRGTVWTQMHVNTGRVRRARAGLTRSELAARAGVPENTVKRWETDVMSVTHEERQKIAKALG